MKLKNTSFLLLGTGLLLLLPIVGKWPWTLIDFTVAGLLLFGIGFALDLAWRYLGKYRIIAMGLLVLLFLWLWAELAVGLFTNWGS